jgi:low affinity Fe/Cu permease
MQPKLKFSFMLILTALCVFIALKKVSRIRLIYINRQVHIAVILLILIFQNIVTC